MSNQKPLSILIKFIQQTIKHHQPSCNSICRDPCHHNHKTIFFPRCAESRPTAPGGCGGGLWFRAAGKKNCFAFWVSGFRCYKKSRNREIEKSRNREIQKSRNREIDKSRNRENEKSRKREIEKSRNREIEKSRNPEIEKSRNREIEKSRKREIEKTRNREIEKKRNPENEKSMAIRAIRSSGPWGP